MESIITPIDRIQSLQSISSAQTTSVADQENKSIFLDLFTKAINTVEDTDYASVIDSENLATGDVDDLHTLSIDNMKSYLAVEMLVQLRNKALDSYNTIMQINV